MDKEIMDLVHKRRKELGLVIQRKKVPKPEGYFIVRENERLSEIRVPGVEYYFTDRTGNLKSFLPAFLNEKWKQYSSKNPNMKLVAVIVISDIWFAKDDGSGIVPSKHPDRIQALHFFIHARSERIGMTFPYESRGKHVVFLEPIETKVKDDPKTRFNNLFPNI